MYLPRKIQLDPLACLCTSRDLLEQVHYQPQHWQRHFSDRHSAWLPMPSAARRAKQKLARERQRNTPPAATSTTTPLSEAIALASSSELQRKTSSSSRRASTQTVVNEWIIRDLIHIYWRQLEQRRADVGWQPLQFIIGEGASTRQLMTVDSMLELETKIKIPSMIHPCPASRLAH